VVAESSTNADVAKVGVHVLEGVFAACGPPGEALSLLTLALGGVLELYGGSTDAPAPALTAADVGQIVNENLLKDDVRHAWSQIASTHDWYRDWTVRAKSGEVFDDKALGQFDNQLADATGPNSGLRQGLNLLYAAPARLDVTPAQYGLPVFILAVGLWIELQQVAIARTAESGGTPSAGQWKDFAAYLQEYQEAIHTCDQLAETQVDRVMMTKGLQPGTAAFQDALAELEVTYRGGSADDLDFPPLRAVTNIVGVLGRLQATGHGS
jgi:hypothetical protein